MILSVLISAYNSSKSINECLNSIRPEVLPVDFDYEVLVVDDGSTDNTKDLILEEMRSNRKIRLITQSNFGSAFSRNLGISQSKGELIIFLDSDDKLNLLEVYRIICDSKMNDFDALRCGWTGKINNTGHKPESRVLNLKDSSFKEHNQYFWDMGFWRYIFRKDYLIKNQIIFSPTFSQMNYPFVLDDFFFLLTFIATSPKIIDVPAIIYFYNNVTDKKHYFNEQIALQPRAIRFYLKTLSKNRLNVSFLIKTLVYRLKTSKIRSSYTFEQEIEYLFVHLKLIFFVVSRFKYILTKYNLKGLYK